MKSEYAHSAARWNGVVVTEGSDAFAQPTHGSGLRGLSELFRFEGYVYCLCHFCH